MTRTLERHFFAGDSDRGPEEELHLTEVRNLQEDVDAALAKHFKWKGTGIGLIGLFTSADNARVDGGQFVVRGKISDGEKRFNCTDLWTSAHINTTITVLVNSCNDFVFNFGGLHSDFLDSSQVNFTCHELKSGQQPTHILPVNFAKWGIGEFCLRMVCHLSRNSSSKKGVVIRYTIILYPGSIESLTQAAGEQGPSWPGIKVTSGEMPLGPSPRQRWKCPILPFIIPAIPFSQRASAPTGDRLRRAISFILSSAGAPETVKNAAALLEKWTALRANPETNFTKKPSCVWPAPTAEPENPGRRSQFVTHT
jgi:hypothetical protein